MLTMVVLSVVALYSTLRSWLPSTLETLYVTFTSTVPGKPSSPSGLLYDSVTQAEFESQAVALTWDRGNGLDVGHRTLYRTSVRTPQIQSAPTT